MKLIIDMNLSPRWVALLRDAKIEAVHWSTIGAGDAPDTEIMAYAAKTKSIVLTHDLDFGAILAATHDAGPSVVQIRAENVNPDAIGGTVVEALEQMTFELTSGALVTVDVDRVRLRILPFPLAIQQLDWTRLTWSRPAILTSAFRPTPSGALHPSRMGPDPYWRSSKTHRRDREHGYQSLANH